jgi:hypothetical protein
MVFLDMSSDYAGANWPGLKWEDFDFKNLHVSVTRSLVRDLHSTLESWGSTRRCRGTPFATRFRPCSKEWRRCQSCTGAVAALNNKDDVGPLHTGPESAEASGAKQGSRHDPLEISCTVVVPRVSGGNPGNSLIRFGSPTGFEPVLPP